jgi:hypothetical protein
MLNQIQILDDRHTTSTFPFANAASKGPSVPDTRMYVDDPEMQEILDEFRDDFESRHGAPQPAGLWAHQLSQQERSTMPLEELERRIAPWQKEFWACLIAKAMQAGAADELPDELISFVAQLFGSNSAEHSESPTRPRPA